MLRESSDLLLLVQAPAPCERCQYVVHKAGAHACEERNAEEDKIGIVPADAVLARIFVEVAKGIELGGEVPCAGKEAVCEEEEGEKVEGNTSLVSVKPSEELLERAFLFPLLGAPGRMGHVPAMR